MSSPFDAPASTVQAIFERAARRAPERGIGIFDRRGRQLDRRSYPEILAAARQAAGRWAGLEVAPREVVMICLTTSWDWMDAWLGAMWRGALPVAVAPGAGLGSADAQILRAEALLRYLGARLLLAPAAWQQEAERLGARRVSEALIAPEIFHATTAERLRFPEPQPADVAFLQLTSGSTGMPRAVSIRHDAAGHNVHAIGAAVDLGAWGRSVSSWLPLHHDMGLVGCLLLAVSGGLDLFMLQPTTFLARPALWLQALGRHGPGLAPAPNFAYQLCVERSADASGIDLADWRVAFTGAEMIRSDTTSAFCDRFGPHGFRPEAFLPCYGMAETTLAVTIDRKGQGVRTLPVPGGQQADHGLAQVACVGSPVMDTEVRVVSAGGPLPELTVGEVEVKGPGVLAGYHGDPEATAAAVADGWLKTGDLGFMADDELYLTGRTKDILIIRGHNLMPHEIEWVAEGVTGGGGARRSGAFSITRGTEGEEAVLVVEVERPDPEGLAQLDREIRVRVGRELSLQLADLVFVRRGKIPKTTSGKVQRRELRARYLRGEVDRLPATAERSPADPSAKPPIP